MIVYFDLVVACFLNQEGSLSLPELRKALATLDSGPGWQGGLLAHLAEHRKLPPTQLSRVAYWTRRYQERYRQALTLRLLEGNGCPQDTIHELTTALDTAPSGCDLASLLHGYTSLSTEEVGDLLQKVGARLRAYGASVLREARETDYAAVSTRLIAGTVIDERALRLSLLFRSEQTSWLLQSKNRLAHAHDASELFAEEAGAFPLFGLSSGQALGDYTITSPLGEGGMGRIYLATRPDGTFVAIKTLRTELAEAQDHARFEREAMILARVEHRSVLPLLDEGTSEAGVRYLVCPAVEGETLSQALTRTGRLPLRESFAIADELLAALEAIHAAGVVHKDLKPENVMLRDRADPSPLCVIDFGLAHLNGHDSSEPEQFMTRGSDLVGTPSYLSPEQVKGEPVTPSCDLYAFGILVFRMLSGKLPFSCKTPFEMLAAHADAIPATLFAADPETNWDPRLQGLLTRLLSKDPADRPASASEVREALARCKVRMLASYPAEASDPNSTTQFDLEPLPPPAESSTTLGAARPSSSRPRTDVFPRCSFSRAPTFEAPTSPGTSWRPSSC